MCSSRLCTPAGAREQEPRTTATCQTPLKRLHCAVQQYAWGRNSEDSEVGGAWSAWRGGGSWRVAAAPLAAGGTALTLPHRLPPPHSQVAQLVAASGQPVDPTKPYAELW